MTREPLANRDASSGELAGLLASAGVGPDSVIHVAGPTGLGALMWFCGHGFRQVSYVRADEAVDEDRDLVFAPHAGDTAALAAILEEGPPVKAGRLLIVLTPEAKAQGSSAANDMLVRAGFDIEHRLQGRHREVLVARRPHDGLENQAA